MTTARQLSFSAGELAPSLYARVDQVRYATGLRTCRNFFVKPSGGVDNRPGTKFVAEVNDSSKTVKLVPFIFNADQTYILEFGDYYMRVHQNGAQLTDSTATIINITQANPPWVSTNPAHGFSTGDEVYISGVVGMSEVNNRNFKISVLNPVIFTLYEMDGVTPFDTTGFGAYSSGGTAQRVYEVATPYAYADLAELQFAQRDDVMTLVHPSYPPYRLTRTGHTSWTFTQILFEPDQERIDGICGTSYTGAGNETFRYRITAINDDTGEESLPSLSFAASINGASQTDPVIVSTTADHGLDTGEEVYIRDVGGMTELNNRRFRVGGVTIDPVTPIYNFELVDEDGTGYSAYTSGGRVDREYVILKNTNPPSVGNVIALDGVVVDGATYYNVYKEDNGVYGWLDTFSSLTGTTLIYKDDGSLDPSLTKTPPVHRNPFSSAGNYPSTVTYYQQRQIFANTNNAPSKIFASATGHYESFVLKSPITDSDSILFTLDGNFSNEIRHLVGLNKLVALTSGGEYVISGDEAGILKPTAINSRQHTYNGSSIVRPVIRDGNVLYIQSRTDLNGSITRDMAFDFQVDGYRGNDMSVFSRHLVEGFTISEWDFQKLTPSVIWMVRSDGGVLALTYLREHAVLGWTRHDFSNGYVENVAVVPHLNEDRVYFVIRRTVDGNTVRYIEQMALRRISDIVDSITVDSALTFDGRHTGSTTMTLSGGSTWAYDETLTLTASASYFESSHVGQQIHLTGSDGTLVRFTIEAYSSATVVTGKPHMTVPAGMRATAISTWGRAVNGVTGLWHLEGEEIAALGDGFVASNPNNPAYTTVTVTNGTAQFDNYYQVVHVGLPIVSDIETLDMDTPRGETLMDKKILLSRVTLYVEASRGIWAGPKPPTSTTALTNLRELKIRDVEGMDDPIALKTGTVDIDIKGEWSRGGRVFIRNVDPVPVSILAIAPAGLIPYRSS
jgi:hypothetical protein